MTASTRYELVDRILDGRLSEWLANARADGESLDTISRRLLAEHGVDVSRETVRRWMNDPKAKAS